MNYKRKYSINFIIIFFMTVIFLIYFYATQLNYNLTIKNNYYKLEEIETEKSIYHFNKIIENKILSQEKILEDYSIWDDTYNNIENKKWITTEIIDWLPDYFNFDNVIIFDTSFNLKYNSQKLNHTAHDKITNIVKQSENSTHSYFEKCNETIALISSSPITPTDDNSKIAGYLVVVTDVTKTFKVEFLDLYGYDINIDYNTSSDNSMVFKEDKIISKYVLKNIDNNIIATLNINSHRQLLNKILAIESNYKLNQIIILIIILILAHISMRITIINPIKKLEHNITSLDTSTYNYLYDDFFIDDINKLIKAFNSLMYKILYFQNEIDALNKAHRLDPLTKIYNRDNFDKYIYHNDFTDLSIVFLDIDNFKLINDYHGHQIGDTILKEIAKIIKLNLPNNSKAFRYGGEEFVISVKGSKYEAFSIAEDVRKNILNSIEVQKYLIDKPISVSCGISNLPSDSSDIDHVIIFADKAMYAAKQNGKNRTTIYRKSFKNNKISNNLDFNLDYIIALSNAIDSKTPYKEEHSKFVSEYSYLIGIKLGFSDSVLQNLKVGGLIHDIGKISISDKLFFKKGPLNKTETNEITNHPLLGFDIMSNATNNNIILSCVRDHHERLDGHGFPKKLEGDDISIYARIISVVNSYHTMISDLPYKPQLTHQEAVKELIDNKGTQFDPKIVDIFINLLD